MSEFAGQRIALIGLAATGLAAAEVLAARGAQVCVYDVKSEDQLAPGAVARAREREIPLVLGDVRVAWPVTDWKRRWGSIGSWGTPGTWRACSTVSPNS